MVVRQSAAPVQYDATRRMDNASHLTTGKAGEVIPLTFVPLHRGDSATGRIEIGIELAEMPRPVENAIMMRAQAWCIPRPALPHFSGLDEYTHAFHGADITALGTTARTPPSLFDTTAYSTAVRDSEFFTVLGIHVPDGATVNTDYVDAYSLVYNFRLAAHSSKMARVNYLSENVDALELKPAFWPRSRMHNIVPDYEQALVKGSLELDVAAGQMPISNIFMDNNSFSANAHEQDGTALTETNRYGTALLYSLTPGNPATGFAPLLADMAGQTVATSLADIDKARTTNAFAKAQTAYAGTNFSGFNNDDVIVADLMQGYVVPPELFNRPWLLDSKTVVFGATERHATDAANLDDSVTTAVAQASLSCNVPRLEYGGVIMATVEVMPERLYERQTDEYLLCTSVDDLPNALRDIQRTEPVDAVPNRRLDAKHTSPGGLYGFEPMNARWKRERTSLGGNYRQMTPGTPNISARNAIWQPDYVDPVLTDDHWLCPHPFPQDVFAVPSDDTLTISLRQGITITGITQFGDELVEDNGEFVDVAAEV